MASGFQEISPLTHPRISFTAITTPQSFRVNLNDATNQIDFIFALNDDPPLASDSVSVSLDRSAPPDSISDDDDGFRTPTSSDHKIPVVQQCPPAPRRPKPISCSRTLPRTSGVRRGFRVYISDEIADSIFCPDLLHQKTKKARKNGNGGE
ncbi:Cyclin-dependent protein kinase inhibitor SMR3, partial [Cucurbita argyrosperma subsp. argyrosperma]